MKKLLLIFAFVLAFCSCEQSTEIIFGANVELSGALAPYGQSAYDGMAMAVEKINGNGGINGTRVKLLPADNRSSAADSESANYYLHSKGASVIFGPTIGTLVKAALCANVDTLMMTPSATADDLTKTQSTTRLVRLCFNDTSQAQAMARYARECGYTTAAVLTDISSDYSKGTSEAFSRLFRELGGQITVTRYFLSNDTDFTAILTDLTSDPPDCIYLPAYYVEAGVIIKQARMLGLDSVFLSGDALDSPALFEIIGEQEYIRDIAYTTHTDKTPEYLAFEAEFTAKFGYPPSAYSALSYDCVMLYAEKLAENGIQNVESAIYNTKGYRGITGEISILPSGDCEKEPFIFVIGED